MYLEHRAVEIDGETLTLSQFESVCFGATVSLANSVIPRINKSREVVDELLQQGQTLYGINTGFGKLSSERIPKEQVDELQRNLILSHSAGVGRPLKREAVRGIMVLRLNSLVRGFSGVRLKVLELLVECLNRDVVPLVPSRGSVGASGDLAPLAHVAAGLMGEGDCLAKDGSLLPAAQALQQAGLKPIKYRAKEALAMINGTQLIGSVGGLALCRAGRLLEQADIIAGMSLEALMGTDSVFLEPVHRARPHPGQLEVAAHLRALLSGSELIESHKHCGRVQDPYSLRCIPQVHGAARDGWNWSKTVFEREFNAASDNPVVVIEEKRVISGGNFHGAPVALACDTAAISLSYLGSMSERRCDKLLDTRESGLPSFLTDQGGLHSGLMIVQYGAAALVNENKLLTHSVTSDSIPTSAGHEDHVSMGPAAAFKLARLMDNLEQILASEWICAAQALEYRRPLRFGPGTERGFALLREYVEPLRGDRALALDLKTAKTLLTSGELLKINV
ncbi:MAG: histidine ammonia-lyase [Vulcanimicrobiota bacterium]